MSHGMNLLDVAAPGCGRTCTTSPPPPAGCRWPFAPGASRRRRRRRPRRRPGRRRAAARVPGGRWCGNADVGSVQPRVRVTALGRPLQRTAPAKARSTSRSITDAVQRARARQRQRGGGRHRQLVAVVVDVEPDAEHGRGRAGRARPARPGCRRACGRPTSTSLGHFSRAATPVPRRTASATATRRAAAATATARRRPVRGAAAPRTSAPPGRRHPGAVEPAAAGGLVLGDHAPGPPAHRPRARSATPALVDGRRLDHLDAPGRRAGRRPASSGGRRRAARRRSWH